MRLLLIIPEGHAEEVAHRLGPRLLAPEFGPPLSPDGLPPVTHRWASLELDVLAARIAISVVCSLIDLATPAPLSWGRWRERERVHWVESIRTALWNSVGAWVALGDVEPEKERQGRGLRPVSAPPGG